MGHKIRFAGLAVIVLAVLAFVVHAALPRPAKAGPPTAHRYRSTAAAVGALVIRKPGAIISRPFCTASVVRSPAGDLILTAAHCLGLIPPKNLAFLPGYRGGRRYPYGLWPVTGQRFPPHWFPGGNVSEDFAFLTVRGDVQAKTGGEVLGRSVPRPAAAELLGYDWRGGYPVSCTRRPSSVPVAGQQQLKFSCGGFIAAASGGPFLTHVDKTGNGTIVGVIGGYQQGGWTASISYSSPFGAEIGALYQAAIGHRRPPGRRNHE